jgi:hypothetical protein
MSVKCRVRCEVQSWFNNGFTLSCSNKSVINGIEYSSFVSLSVETSGLLKYLMEILFIF